MTKTRLMALLVLSVTLICGCMGGGGGSGSTPAFEKDVVGITTTLNRFAESLRTGDPTSSGIFAQTTGTSENTKILYVKDFGADLSNPEDNQTWEFRVNPADITQPAPDTAIVKTSKVMSTGNTLWLIFSMLKEQGQWKIQGITIQEAGVTSLVTASYYPIVPGNRMTYYGTYQGGYNINSVEYSSTETYQYEGVTYYRFVSSNYAANLRQSGLTGIGSYFANRQGEIWTYDPYVNGGVPYRLLKAMYAPGEKDVIVQKYGESESSTMTLTMGSQMKPVVTPLRTFLALPITLESSHAGYSEPATHTSVLYFVEGVGLIGQESFEPGTTTVAYSEYLYERLVNGVVESNNPVIVPPAANTQKVVKGRDIVPIQFNATGGSTPLTWNVNDAPGGVTITSDGYLSGKTDANAAPAVFNLTISVVDAYKRYATFAYSIDLIEATPLSITPTNGSQNVTVGHVINSVQFTAANATGGVNWSITGNPVGVSLSKDGLLSGELSSSVPPGDYPMFITATDTLGGLGSVEYRLAVQAGSFLMSLYSPLNPGDEYTYVPVENSVASEGRYIQGIGMTPLTINGLDFYPEYESYANPSAAPVNPVTPVVNIRRSLASGIRPSARIAALRAELAPEDEPFYRAVDTDGNIWFYQKYTNGGAPFKALRTWYNPGDVDVYVSNYNDNTDQYVATTTMTVENSLVDFFTPYQQFTGVLKITFITEIDFGEGFTFKSKSEQFYVKDLGLVGYYSYSPINQTEFESSPDYMELLLSARVRGTVYENLPKINSASVLSDAIIGSLYPVTLNSTGGVFPHKFTLIAGAPPLGLTLTENGQFSGTVQDQLSGAKTFTVKLSDVYHQFYIQEFSITVR